MPIQSKIFQTQLDQYIWVGNEIQQLVYDKKIQPSEIAIIARKHEYLMNIVPYLEGFKIEMAYERGQNVLQKKEIAELVAILRFIDSLNKANIETQEELLPEILCFEFLRLDPKDIYELSQFAYKNRKTWLESMLEIGKEDLKIIAEFLLELGVLAKNSYLEQVIDEITGVGKESFVSDTTEEETPDEIINKSKYDPNLGAINVIEKMSELEASLTKYISGFKWYYFDRLQKIEGSGQHLAFLSSLKVFIESIRSYKTNKSNRSGELLKVSDLIEYVDLLNSRNIRLVDNSPYNSSVQAISLLTAHKSKGLEFEYVYVIDCLEEAWNGRKMVNKVGLPSNLALLPQAENLDDSLRLFFVAITRAKTYLSLSSYKYGKDSKEVEILGCLTDLVKFEEISSDSIETLIQKNQNLSIYLETKQAQSISYSPLVKWFEATLKQSSPNFNLRDYLIPQLENYKLSVTHLNNFLDLVRGGPRYFLEKNLLGFPQGKSPLAAYGTAMHASINELYKEFKRTGCLPDLEFLLSRYRLSLLDQRLNLEDQKAYLEKGLVNLELYYKDQSRNFNITDRTEEDFKNQGVVIGDAKITGKIDKMILNGEDKMIDVVDFKTGKAHQKWHDSALETAIKLQNYRRQLVFYKLLVENSRDFSSFKVESGSLEFLDIPFAESSTVILKTEIDENESVELAKLIQVVYKKIVGLAKGEVLPDVSKYSRDLSGIEEFIADLLNGKC